MAIGAWPARAWKRSCEARRSSATRARSGSAVSRSIQCVALTGMLRSATRTREPSRRSRLMLRRTDRWAATSIRASGSWSAGPGAKGLRSRRTSGPPTSSSSAYPNICAQARLVQTISRAVPASVTTSSDSSSKVAQVVNTSVSATTCGATTGTVGRRAVAVAVPIAGPSSSQRGSGTSALARRSIPGELYDDILCTLVPAVLALAAWRTVSRPLLRSCRIGRNACERATPTGDGRSGERVRLNGPAGP